MKKLFGKRLREKLIGDTVRFSWYRLRTYDFVALFIVVCLAAYLIAEYLGWEELRGLKIVSTNLTAKVVMYGSISVLTIYLLFNRKSVLLIDAQKRMCFRKRRLTGKKWRFSKKKITNVHTKLEKNHHESDTAYYPDIYHFSITLQGGKKLYLGSFNEKDCETLKGYLKK